MSASATKIATPGVLPNAPCTRRWTAIVARVAALALSAGLFTVSQAPYAQFYLAWIALVPWLWVVVNARRARSAFAWGFLGGAVIYGIHLASYFRLMIVIPIEMVVILAIISGVVAMVARSWMRAATSRPIRSTFCLAAAWVAAEWFRGRAVFEYPVYYLGHSQSPFHAVAQIADLFGVYGCSFLVAGVNACVALLLFGGASLRQKLRLSICWSGLVLLALVYGVFRLQQPLAPGPRVMVVQSTLNFGPGGTASLNREAHLNLLLSETAAALAKEKNVDLVVWPESVTPPINPEAREELRTGAAGPQLARMDQEISSLAAKNHTGIILGGYYIGDWKKVNGQRIGTDIRNSAYLYDRAGEQVARYDKIHLVPYGEYIPLRDSVPWLGNLLAKIAPWQMEYVLNPGLVTASLPKLGGDPPLRLLPAICFEECVAPQIATMACRPGESTKSADVIVNMSNDGWFSAAYMAQRAQAAEFRAIENRLPMARAESGGVSGLFDSRGRTLARLPAWKNGYAVEELPLDSRTTLYQRIGDVLPLVCLLAMIALAIGAISCRRTPPSETAADPRPPDAPRQVARRRGR